MREIRGIFPVLYTSCSFPHYYFICLRKACQAIKVSINLSPKSVPLLLTIYINLNSKGSHYLHADGRGSSYIVPDTVLV